MKSHILHLLFLGIMACGLGKAFSNQASLNYMMKSSMSSGLPDSEQTRGMVSSLWSVSYNLGGYMGATLGGVIEDELGFSGTMLVGAVVMGVSVVAVVCYGARLWCKGLSGRKEENDDGANFDMTHLGKPNGVD